MTNITELTAKLRHWASMASVTSERVSCLSVEQLTEVAEALEAAEKRIAELEQSEWQLIGERDDAEAALADMYEAATGERPEWSNWFSFDDAVESVSEKVGVWLDRIKQVDSANAVLTARIAELESRTLTVKMPDDGMDDCYDLWGPEHCRNTFDCGYNFSAVRHEEAIREACAVAGIKLQIEGE